MAGKRRTHSMRAAKVMRRFGWYKSEHDNRITGRLYHLALRPCPWWDWGHRVMILVGTCVGGNYDEPEPATWFYRKGEPKRMWRTGYPRHPLSTFEVITDYSTFRERTAGLNEDEMYEWQAIGLNQDGELILGHRYWGGNFYGLNRWDQALLRKYLRRWHRKNWWGLRSWLYSQALHAAVHRRKPFTCQAVPPRGSGGYDHWYCTLKRKHDGLHQFNTYKWGDVGGEAIFAHVPEVAGRP